MKLNQINIAIKKIRSIPTFAFQSYMSDELNQDQALTMQAEIMNLGFIMTKDLFNIVAKISKKHLKKIYKTVITSLKELVGADVEYKAFYPNFPQQVIESSHYELFFNAMLHYWTSGEWTPKYETLPRELCYEDIKFKELDVCTEKEFMTIFDKIVTSNDSVSKYDKSVIEFFIDNYSSLKIPETIPFKENMCIVAGKLIDKGRSIKSFIKTATDILRIATYLSDGDVSLAKNSKFKSFPRRQRKVFAQAIELVATLEDLQRHRNKWVKLFHSLHIGTYGSKLYDLAKILRTSSINISTTNSYIERAIIDNNLDEAINCLKNHPGDFARRLDHLLRKSNDPDKVIKQFQQVAGKVSTRVLIQLLGHFYGRSEPIDKIVVFPKGNVQKAMSVKRQVKQLNLNTCTEMCSLIRDALAKRFSELSDLGNVWISQELKKVLLPSQQRSASDGMFSLGRGSRIAMLDKKFARFFIYWKEPQGKAGERQERIDLDLSASFYDDEFKKISDCAYYRLKNSYSNDKDDKDDNYAVHSGDFVTAPNGACEFIDVDIDKAKKMTKARYLIMNIFSFTGQPFSANEKCYAGFMMRDEPAKNAIFDATTVEQKINLSSSSKNNLPIIFDLKEREFIWCDLATNSKLSACGNAENHRAGIKEVLESIINQKNKVNLYDLISLHVAARNGIIVEDKTTADSVFDIDFAYDVNTINAELIV